MNWCFKQPLCDHSVGIIDTIMKDTYWKDYVKNKVQEESNYLAWMCTDAMDSSFYPAPFPKSTMFPMGCRPNSIHLGRSIASMKLTNGSEGMNNEADLWEKSVSNWSTNLDQTFEMPGLGMTWANTDNNYARWGRDAEPWMLCGSPIQVEPFIINTGLKIERMDRDDTQKLWMPDVPVDATTNRVNGMTIVDKGIEPSATICCLPMNHTMIAPCTDRRQRVGRGRQLGWDVEARERKAGAMCIASKVQNKVCSQSSAPSESPKCSGTKG